MDNPEMAMTYSKRRELTEKFIAQMEKVKDAILNVSETVQEFSDNGDTGPLLALTLAMGLYEANEILATMYRAAKGSLNMTEAEFQSMKAEAESAVSNKEVDAVLKEVEKSSGYIN